MKLTAQDLLALGLIDEVIAEPLGGAHREPARAIHAVGDAIDRQLGGLLGLPPAELRHRRREKFLRMGQAEG
jgi:acetyl-CoA carboxylase carboxyl transferase subunit alpha